ncbi:uncharacterized protein LOC133842638 isoform X1 [Drosophila sulfurigaster albostrigata]|uniref:uncharacterized protein LOC133842638 isoform X1 n=1 Tax=Drosophila sulfurigaster albostrigata TaxID=89887 RepID=UPI002D21A107|nr:uncharacterized protein LOC133842638 isoform X1 [Drosophila sulfurigaster albostrigata]
MFKEWRKPNHKRWQQQQHQLQQQTQRQLRRRMLDRETMIVFVYDTECLKDEADDPIAAVLYFHPSWVSDTQKVALCGQLMGTSYFLKDCFFKPRILSLQNGKFVLKEFGRFTLAVGTDRNIADQLLEHRANLLSSLLKFFHRDLQSLHEQYAQPAQQPSRNLSEKLYHIFETYLPMLQRNGNTFQNVPKLRMPKTASHIYLEAIQTLQSCQQTKGILGGAILYHNKVVASQLGDVVTKQLVLTDPRHVRTTAEQLNMQQFHIPHGVQMLVVYVEQQQYAKLAAEAQRAQNLQTTTSQLVQGSLPFQYAKRKLKRDKSLIFTHIPEEEHASDTTSAMELPTARPKSMRPTHLPLRLKSLHSKDLPESGIASINFDETDSYPEFIGRTSVCNTPMTENKVLPVATVMSICANPDEEQVADAHNSNGKSSTATASSSRRNSLKMDVEKFFQNFIGNPHKQLTRRKSSADLQDALRAISKKLGHFTHSFKTTTDVNRNGNGVTADISSEVSPDYIENDERSSSRTIGDPTYPVFNTNGQQISGSLFQQFLEQYRKLWGAASEQASQDAELAALVAEFQEFNLEIQKLDEHMRQQAEASAEAADRNLNVAAKTPMDKRAMCLPLKPAGESSNVDAPLSQRRVGGAGVPLTPLMAKLSVLALNEATPIEIQTPLNSSKVFPRRNSLKCEDAVDALSAFSNAPQAQLTTQSDGLQRTELYICGQQNMTLLLLMEEGSCRQQTIVQKMFDICVAKFPHMESLLNQTLNVNVEGDKRDGSNYSFMCIDAKWDALQRNGPWNPLEMTTLESMHRDLQQPSGQLTDLILRSHDSVFYGYKCGRTEYFYKEPTHEINGIPPPSDPIGNIQMRAKSRLERDHSYMLL